MSKHDERRANRDVRTLAAKGGGPNYRATPEGKGDVNRVRNRSKYDLGIELMELAETLGHDSPEYEAKLEEWRNA